MERFDDLGRYACRCKNVLQYHPSVRVARDAEASMTEPKALAEIHDDPEAKRARRPLDPPREAGRRQWRLRVA